MGRKDFAQVLLDADVNIKREYDRLYSSFYIQKNQDSFGNVGTLNDFCGMAFINMPFRGTCLTLDDFDEFYGFHFEKIPSNFDIDYLITFCEYTYNLILYTNVETGFMFMSPKQLYIQQVMKVIDIIGYMGTQKNGVTVFVPKSEAAIEVSKILPDNLSYKVIEYNHHSLKGNLEGKKTILLLLADKLEGSKDKLGQTNNTLKTNIFFAFNNLNLRHNNCDVESKHYKEYIATMDKQDLETWYDETYQLCLLAFLELNNVERTKKFDELKKKING